MLLRAPSLVVPLPLCALHLGAPTSAFARIAPTTFPDMSLCKNRANHIGPVCAEDMRTTPPHVA